MSTGYVVRRPGKRLTATTFHDHADCAVIAEGVRRGEWELVTLEGILGGSIIDFLKLRPCKRCREHHEVVRIIEERLRAPSWSAEGIAEALERAGYKITKGSTA